MGYRSNVWRLRCPAGTRRHGAEGPDVGGRPVAGACGPGPRPVASRRRSRAARGTAGPPARFSCPQPSRACAGSKPSGDRGPTQRRERRLRPLYRCFFRRASFVNPFVVRSFGNCARKSSGFFACSMPWGGVGGQDGLGRIGWPSSAARSTWRRAVASQPTIRAHPTLAPSRALSPAGTAEPGVYVTSSASSDCFCRHAGWGCVRPTEVGSVDPHAMQHDGKLARERDFCGFQAAAFGDPHCPGPERRPSAVMQ